MPSKARAVIHSYWPGRYLGDKDPFMDEDWHCWAFPNISDFNEQGYRYNKAIIWIKKHVVGWEDNAKWKMVSDCYYIQLRNEADAIMFTLKFGTGSNDK